MERTNDTSAKASFRHLVLAFLYLVIFPVILFFLAGDWRWAEGWVFSIILFLLSYATVIYLYIKDPALLNERFGSPIQKEQKSWDKILLSSFVIGYFVWFAIMPLDARRFGWSPEFPLRAKVAGTLLFTLGFLVVFGALRENTFAAPVVKMQKERGQKVISTGAYSIVRHPMYAGAMLLFIGAPLLLGSLSGLIIGFLLIVVIAVRSIGEEKMLRRELDGYDEYMKRVRWRMLPFVF